MKTILAAIVAVTLVLVFSAVTVAQDKTDVKAKKDEMKDMGKEMSGLMSVSCDTVCGFRIVSHDQAEIIAMVKQHSKAHHQMDVSDADVKGMMKPAMKMGMRDKMKQGEMKDKEKEKDEKDPHKH